MRVYYSLYGHLLNKARLFKGFKKVFKARGAAGIDGQSLSAFASNLDNELSQLLLELKGGALSRKTGAESVYWVSQQSGIEWFNNA